MTPIKDIIPELKKNLRNLNGTPHSVSYPLITVYEGKFYIVVFCYVYDVEFYNANVLPRPDYWALADLATGEIRKIMACEHEDFSKEPALGRYFIVDIENSAPTKEFFQELWDEMDKTRQNILEHGSKNRGRIDTYVKLLSVVPQPFQIFYDELFFGGDYFRGEDEAGTVKSEDVLDDTKRISLDQMKEAEYAYTEQDTD